MIVTNYVSQKVSPVNVGRLKALGYLDMNLKVPHLRYEEPLIVNVSVIDLQSKSNAIVECWCENCEVFYSVKFANNTQYCKKCAMMYGAIFGAKTRDKSTYAGFSVKCGSDNPRWNPNKSEYKSYCAEVTKITKAQDLSLLENFDKPRGLCGVDGAYQLDHKISKHEGFAKGIPAEVIGDITNLQFIPWEANRSKWNKQQLTNEYVGV